MTEHTVADFEPGQGVAYRPYPTAPAEQGEVVRVNDTYVFVRFSAVGTAAACRPADLESLSRAGGVA